MPNPRRRHGRSRQGKDRSHLAMTPPQTVPCEQCGAPKVRHRVCQQCGTYKKAKVQPTQE